MRSMSTTASVHRATIIHIVKMVFNVSMKNSKITNAISGIDECESSPCSNEGTCIDEINGYHCICAFGYNYTHCQNGDDESWVRHASYTKVCIFLEINECESTPCSNGGTCINLINGYHCICPSGFNYTHCQNGLHNNS